MNFKAITILLTSLIATYAIAEDEDDLLSLYEEDGLISIATGTEKQARFAPAVASVITQQDIKRIGAKTLDEALEMVPGLHVSNSFNRQDAVYSIRGIHTGQNPQVLLLIDGVRMQQVFSGARPFNFELSTSNIERIEIIRGPGSAVYGADAFAGVISVTTKSASGMKSSVVMGGRVGSFKRREAWLHAADEWAGIKVNLALDYAVSDGDNDRVIYNDAQSLSDASASIPTTSFAPGPLNTDIEHWNTRINFDAKNWDLALFSWNLVDAGLGTGGGQALDPIGEDQSDYFGAQFNTKPYELSQSVTLEGRLGATVYDLDPKFVLLPAGSFAFGSIFPNGVIGNPSGREKTYTGEFIASIEVGLNHNIRTAAGFQYSDFTAKEIKNFVGGVPGALVNVSGTVDAYLQNVNREHYYAYVQDEWAIADDWQATVGLRYDRFTQFGDTFNPRVALVWATNYNLTTKFLYGRAFRAPSFSELYTKNNPSLVGNENLEPEIIDTLEVAFDYRHSYALGMKLNLFYYEIEDLVQITFNTPASNTVEQSGRGFEFELNWDITEAISLMTNYAWQQAENDDTGEDVASAPQQQLYVSGQLQIDDNKSVSMVVNWVADRERPKADTRSPIDDYITVNAIFNHQDVFDGIDLSLSVKNVFNEDVREPGGIEIPDDYPMEGRSINVEISYSLD